jgi:hypothetical protein
MPWVTKNGKRKFEPRLPIPEITPPKPPFPDLEFRDRYPREQRAHLMWWRRHIAEYVELYLDCPRLACRRNKACCGQDVPCHDQWDALLREHVYPLFREGLRKMANKDEAEDDGTPATPDPLLP